MYATVDIHNFRARLAATIMYATLNPVPDPHLSGHCLVEQLAQYRDRPDWVYDIRLTAFPGRSPPPGLWRLVPRRPAPDPDSLVRFPPRPGVQPVDIFNLRARHLDVDFSEWQVQDVTALAARQSLPIPPGLMAEFTSRGLRPLYPLGPDWLWRSCVPCHRQSGR